MAVATSVGLTWNFHKQSLEIDPGFSPCLLFGPQYNCTFSLRNFPSPDSCRIFTTDNLPREFLVRCAGIPASRPASQPIFRSAAPKTPDTGGAAFPRPITLLTSLLGGQEATSPLHYRVAADSSPLTQATHLSVFGCLVGCLLFN
jgi:hypothetical protein